MKITADHITTALLVHREFGRKSWCMPRFTPSHWWECDLAEISRAHYLTEYEIKLTRQDFKADAKKRQGGRRQDLQQQHLESIEEPSAHARRRLEQLKSRAFKHDQLAAGDPHGPARFWYVTTPGLIQLEELPDWAGLLEVGPRRRQSARYPYLQVQTVRPAPRLHRQKVDPQVLQQLKDCCYYRLLQRFIRDGQYVDCSADDSAYAPACSSTPPTSSSPSDPCWSGPGSGI